MLRKAAKTVSSRYPFGADDFLQQVIGGVLLTAPFIFTEEVWTIAANMSDVQSSIMVAASLLIGHGVLYIAHQERDWDTERKLIGVTYRYISLMAVAFGTVTTLILVTGADQTLGGSALQTVSVVALVSPFAVVGAATADSLIQGIDS
ncbi:MAG: DUF2391 family protein [Candidatus Nanohaloarchaea archaeon]